MGPQSQQAAGLPLLTHIDFEGFERRSVVVTSNLVFSQWDRIFKDPLTTAAAIDRIDHNAVILELTGPSYRTEAAKSRLP